MKKITILMLTALLCVGLCACKSDIEGSDTPLGGGVGVSNPYVQVDSPADFESKISVSLPIPQDAGDIVCTICNNQFAQIDCIIGADEFCFRAQLDTEGKDLAGVHGEWTSVEAGQHALYYTCENTSIAIFKVGTCCYTVTTAADVSTLINIVEEYMTINSFREM